MVRLGVSVGVNESLVSGKDIRFYLSLQESVQLLDVLWNISWNFDWFAAYLGPDRWIIAAYAHIIAVFIDGV